MRIPTYCIYNVLKQYTDQLTGGSGRDECGIVGATPVDDAGFFATIKRRELFDMIEKTIKYHISRMILPDCREQKNETLLSKTVQREAVVKNGEFTPFVYNAIDKDHRKVKRTLSVTKFYEP